MRLRPLALGGGMNSQKPLTRFVFIETDQLPAYDAAMSEYLFGANGLFRRARRPGLEAIIPATAPQRLLKTVEPAVQLQVPRVPIHLVREVLREAQHQCVVCGEFRETLFYYCWDAEHGQWTLHVPPQDQMLWSVRATDTGADSAYARALIEVHSHHWEKAFFSRDDNRDEVGFRIYAVLGRIFEHPELRVRVSVYGDWWELPAAQIFELPEEVRDCYGEE